MKHKQIVALLLCASLITPAISVSAAQGTDPVSSASSFTADDGLQNNSGEDQSEGQSSTGSLLNADLDGIFSDMSNSLLNGQSLTLSDAIQNNSDLKMSTDSQFDMSDLNLISSTAVDMGLVNMQYQNLASSLSDSFNGMNLSGKSQDCMSLFDNTYGGIAEQLSLSNSQLPEGFTVSNMINSASNAVNSMYSSASNSGSFSSIKGSVSVGKIFSAANAGLIMPSLASDSELKSTIAGLDSANYSKAYSSYLTSKMDVKSHTKNATQLADQTNKNFLSIVDMSGANMNLDGSINQDNLKESISNVDDMFTDVTGAKYDTFFKKLKYNAGNIIDDLKDTLGLGGNKDKNKAGESGKAGSSAKKAIEKGISHGLGQ